MTAQEFEQLFDTVVINGLSPLGFRARCKSGRTLDLLDGITLVSLFRLGGRLSLPGSVVWTLCFRHTFLRELNELRIVDGVTGMFTECYPFKFTPSELMDGRRELRYNSQLNWNYDRFIYDGLSPEDVREKLRSLTDLIAGRFVPWARGISPTAAREQLHKFGNGRWDEKIWIEDYDGYIQANVR